MRVEVVMEGSCVGEIECMSKRLVKLRWNSGWFQPAPSQSLWW